MDIRATLKEFEPRRSYARWIVGVAALLTVSGFLLVLGRPEFDLDASWSSRVQRGPFEVFVTGYGNLKSKAVRLLTSRTAATVDEIYIKPGQPIQQDSVVLRLLDPDTVGNVERARLAWASAVSELNTLALKNQDEELALRSRILDVESEHNALLLEKQAIEKIDIAGVMARIDFDKITIKLQQLQGQLNFEQQRLESMRRLHAESLHSKQALVKEFERQLGSEQTKLDGLSVRSGMAGVLQKLYVELGQSVRAGDRLALVGSADQLYAELTVPQRDVSRVTPGQRVSMNTFGGTASGVVTRVDPVVADGRVTVDVQIEPPMPDNARPELAIEGKIVVATLQNSLFIEAPPGVREGQSSDLYVIDETASKGRKVRVEFGFSSGRHVQIRAGAREGELLVMSDRSRPAQGDETTASRSGERQ